MVQEDARAERPSLRLKRHYEAPPEALWRAWTDPQALKWWWSPGENDVVHLVEADVRVGGRFRLVFTDEDGLNDVSGEYREVVPPRKLVFTWTWKQTPERQSLVTVMFKPAPGGTDLELLHEQFFDADERDSHKEGWTGALAKLRWMIASADSIKEINMETKVDTTADEVLIRKLVENWARAVRNEDIAGILAHHADDMLLFDVPPPVRSKGIDAYRKSWESLFFPWFKSSAVFDLSELDVCAGDKAAFATCLIHCTGTGGAAGKEELNVRLTIGLRKTDGRWTVVHEHHSVPDPSASPAGG
jgi:uncharacterized protein (TIGR02246 family)